MYDLMFMYRLWPSLTPLRPGGSIKTLIPEPCTLHPMPSTLKTLIPEPCTLHPKP